MAEAAIPRKAKVLGYGAAVSVALLALAAATLLPQVLAGGVLQGGIDWAPSLGIGLGFLLDGLSLTFALLILGIGAVIFVYATGYLGAHRDFGRFVLLLYGFMLSMLGLVLARDLITLFVFWELTSVTSYLLIGFDHDRPGARRNALQALLLTGAGGLALLAGFVLIGMAGGSTDLAVLLQGDGLQEAPLYGGILVLVLLGAFTKSAQVPFHFWLPNAMAAPTPVSAYLHSATMVKAGIYLLARLHPLLAGTPGWEISLTLAGAATALLGAVLALRQSDLKQLLAYTTLMALGTLTLFLAGDSPAALGAAVTFLVVHSLYKAALFMVVGGIDHATHSREITALSGLRRAMPLTALAAGLAAASMAGLPPLLGWIGKEMLYAGAVALQPAAVLVPVVLLANALIFAVAGVVGLRPFFGASSHPGVRESGWPLLLGPLLLGGLGLLFGLAPGLLQPLLGAVVAGSLRGGPGPELHLWGGINGLLALSLATFALGTLIYLAQDRLRAALSRGFDALPAADAGWDRLLEGLKALAGWQTRVIQTGRLSRYLAVTFSVLALVLIATLLARRPVIALNVAAPAMLWVIAALMVTGAALVLTTRSRIANIGGLGAVGLGMALIFISFGAPDVATTQLMVETLSGVLFGIVLLRLPGLVERRSRGRQIRDAAIALAVGLCVTLVVLAVASHPLDRRLTAFFEAASYAEAHGRNIVNVILVDFRAFDTFGELTVVFLAAVGAFALLKRRSRRPGAETAMATASGTAGIGPEAGGAVPVSGPTSGPTSGPAAGAVSGAISRPVSSAISGQGEPA